MAKRTCDPTIGSIGRQTYLLGRNGQVVRTRAIPANPNTAQQQLARGNLKLASKAYDQLTQAQISAWIARAEDFQTRPRLGMSGVMTGNQLFVKLNAANLECGEAIANDPVADPVFTPHTPTGASPLVVENDAAVATMTIAHTGALPTTTRLLAAAPQKAGVRRIPEMVDLGELPALVGGVSDFSALYTARFGVPAVDSRVFVGIRQFLDGFYGPTTQLTAVTIAA
jgi:hypothetical protein